MNPLASWLTAILAGAWRTAPPSLTLSEQEIAAVAPLLLDTGAAGLGWWRLHHAGQSRSRAALALKQGYRLHTLEAGLHEAQLQQVLTALQSAGVDPILGKGWAAVRLYPEPGLRPYGDLDLYVRPEQCTAAQTILASAAVRGCPVDLHAGFPDSGECTFAELHERSRLVQLGFVGVRVFGPEDHLRHLCLHLLRHGAWRPLWLCDVAAALEARPAEFDWNHCLKGDSRQADWIACAIGLAHQLLGVRVADTPVARRAKQLPRWLAPSVLRQWGRRYLRYQDSQPLSAHLRRPTGLLDALRHRWPNPIEATVSMNGAFDETPRVLYQLGDCAVRTVRFGMSLLSAASEGRKSPVEVVY